MTFTKLALAASALMLAAPAFAQTTTAPMSGETREQRQGLNPQASSNPASGAGKVDPGGVSGTEAGKTTATGGNSGGAAGRN